MSNNFDDFFNEFFGENKKNDKDENNNDEKVDQTNQDTVEQFINMINKFDNDSKQSLGEFLDKELGEPDKIEFFDDEDFFFEKRIWYTPHGKIVKIRMIEPPETPEEFYNHNLLGSLESELETAIQEENFEEAARIRDLINKRK
jgi:hypothetical protein